jgi:hypothetical protein
MPAPLSHGECFFLFSSRSDPMATSETLDEQAKTEWRNHGLVSDELVNLARRLLQAAGYLDNARHALELAADEEYEIPPGAATPVSLARHEEFARECGYATYAEMSHFAEPVGDAEDKDWYLTPVQGGHWVIWNDCDCAIEERFASHEEAVKRFHVYQS